MPDRLPDTDVVILCGGLGKRLQEDIGGIPKGMAPIRGRPMLDLIVDELVAQGLRRFVLAVGYLREQIVHHFAARHDAEFVVSAEKSPLGTGGAVAHALASVKSDPFFVVNGDSYCAVSFESALQRHRSGACEATIVVTKPDDRSDTGTVVLDASQRVVRFAEKAAGTPGPARYMNAGIYVLQKRIFGDARPEFPFSLEYDVFPNLSAAWKLGGFVVDAEVIDIGTPGRYRYAQTKLP